MRKVVMSVALAAAVLSTSCLGSFHAVTSLKHWNDSASDNKFVNNLLFWAMNIVPVYPIFVLGDAVIFNLIEFWSGSNPLAMEDGDIQIQTIEHEGNLIEMRAMKNKMEIAVLEGPKKGNNLELNYNVEEQAWYANKDGESIKLSSFEDGKYLVHLPSQTVEIDEMTSRQEGIYMINEAMFMDNTMMAAN